MRPVNPYFRKKHGRKPPHLKNRHEEAKNQTGNRAERLVEYARNPNERNDTSWNVLKWNGPALHSSGRRPPFGRGTRNWSAVSHRRSFGRRFARCVGEKQDEAGRETTLPLRTGAAVYELRAADRRYYAHVQHARRARAQVGHLGARARAQCRNRLSARVERAPCLGYPEPPSRVLEQRTAQLAFQRVHLRGQRRLRHV